MFHRPKADNAPEEKTAAQRPAGMPAQAAAPPVRQPATTFTNTAEKKEAPMSMNAEEKADQTTETARAVDIPGTMSRTVPTPPGAARVPGMYPGYPGSAPVYGAAAHAANEAATGRKLVVGQGINLSGEIEACDHLIVEGKVEAALKGASVLDIAVSGVFYGTVEIDEATIAGRFEGDLSVNGRLTVKSTGSITGAIAYKELAVDAGAVIDGKIGPLKEKSSEKKSDRGGRAAEVNSTRPRQESRPEQQGGELFSTEKMAAAAE